MSLGSLLVGKLNLFFSCEELRAHGVQFTGFFKFNGGTETYCGSEWSKHFSQSIVLTSQSF